MADSSARVARKAAQLCVTFCTEAPQLRATVASSDGLLPALAAALISADEHLPSSALALLAQLVDSQDVIRLLEGSAALKAAYSSCRAAVLEQVPGDAEAVADELACIRMIDEMTDLHQP